MKRILSNIFLTAVAALIFAACEPQYVLPTTEREGFTSISAYFTSGEYNNLELARLEVTGDMLREGRLVIKVPYYYPESSDKATTKYLGNLRMKAELDKNCRIYPPLTILDLNLENEFTYTDAKGNDYPIVITGKRVKSDKASFVSFSLVGLFDGFVDNDERIIYLYTKDDLSSCKAEAQVSAHAEIVTDLSVAKNYNEPQKIVIRAHNGKEYEYVTQKAEPVKIRNGFNKESIKPLFNFDPKSRYGTPDYLDPNVNPSIASIEGKLVVCLGTGATPFYVHGTTGDKLGEIALGEASPGGIANDDAGNLLIANALSGKGKLRIYRTSSVETAPTLFYEYDNETALPVGAKLKVNGNIDDKAIITLPYSGVVKVTEALQFLHITVEAGKVTEAKVVDLAPAGLSWGAFSASSAGFAAASSDPKDGVFTASYSYRPNYLNWLDSSFKIGRSLASTSDQAWAWNPNCLDCKLFNNVEYLAMLVLAHFPEWGGHPTLYIYNVNNKASLTGEFTDSPALVVCSDNVKSLIIKSFNAVNAANTISSGDVTIAQSSDGFKIFVYYYDQYAGAIGGFVADCIKRN